MNRNANQLLKLIGSQDLNCCTSKQNLQHD
nr:hypothetical protein NDC12_pgp017 [Polyopes affinis]WOL37119.1 hypothetical protein [Polyopes affinis]